MTVFLRFINKENVSLVKDSKQKYLKGKNQKTPFTVH